MTSHRTRSATRRHAGGVAVLVALLLVPSAVLPWTSGGATPGPGGTTGPAGAWDARTAAAPASGVGVLSTGATAPGWAGSVVRTLLPNYNGSLAGGFPSTVADLTVGMPAYLPGTNELWWPELPHASNGSPIPPTGPAIVYSLADHAVRGIEAAVANASALAFDPDNGRLYAAEPRNDSVGVFDASTGARLGPSIPVGTEPRALGYDPASQQLFVANSGSNNVTVIDTTTDQVAVAGLAVGSRPVALVVDSTDELVYVADAGVAELSVLDARAPAGPSRNISLFGGPATALAWSAAADKVAAIEPSRSYLAVLQASTAAVIDAIVPVGTGCAAVAATADGAQFVVANTSGSTLVLVNASAPFAVSPVPLEVGPGPSALAIDPASGRVVVFTQTDRALSEVDLAQGRTVHRSTPLLSAPGALAYDAAAGRLFVADPALPGIEVLDPNSGATVAPPLVLPGPPDALVLDATAGLLYVAMPGEVAAFFTSNGTLFASNRNLPGANGPLVLDLADALLWVGRPTSGEFVGLFSVTLGLVVRTPPIGVVSTWGSSAALAPSQGLVFAVNASSDTVRAFNATTGSFVGGNVVAGTNVTSVAYDPADGLLYVAGDDLAAIDPTSLRTVLSSVPLGPHQATVALAFDPSHDLLLARSVDARGAASLSVVGGSTPSAANASLLVVPAGLGGGAVVALPTPPGSLPGAGAVVSTNSASGTISVLAAPPVVLEITFSPSPVDLNGTTTGVLLATGGAGPVAVSWSGLPAGCAPASTLRLLCQPTVQGTFTVAVTVTDPLGQSSGASTSLVVGVPLSLSASVPGPAGPTVDVGTPVTCRATVSGGSPPYLVRWSFGDGGTGEGSLVNHTFTATGPVAVAVTATDAGGGSVSATLLLTVAPLPTVSVTTDAPGQATDANLSVTFRANVTGGTAPGSGNWTFDDGSSAGGLAVTHAFARPGVYRVVFSYVDASGVRTGAQVDLLVHPALAGAFHAGNRSGHADVASPLRFVAQISGGSPPYVVRWTFGDGSLGEGLSPEHAYARAGSYAANVTVTDAAGAELQAVLPVTVGSTVSSAWIPGGSIAGLAVGLMLGGAVAAVALYGAERARHRRRFRPPRPYVPPTSPSSR